MPVTSYSTTAGNNNGAPPNGAPEGMAPSDVNNVIRQIMADLAVEAQTNAVKTLNTIAGADTITADMNPELTAYATGMIICFTPASNNTGAATINIDGLGAKSIVKGDGAALAAGDLQASTIHVCIYDGTNFVVLNPQTVFSAATFLALLLTVDGAGSGLDADLLDGLSSAAFAQFTSGNFTGTLTGMTAGTTGTVYYRVTGNKVTIDTGGSVIQGTSNSTSMTMTGVPAGIRPTVAQTCPVLLVNNGVLVEGWAEIGTGGTITFGVGVFGNFTASGTKGTYNFTNLDWDKA